MWDKVRNVRARYALSALVLTAFALRVYRLGFQSLWRDEADAIIFATRALPRLLSTFTRPKENGPLYFLLLRPWITLVGDGEFCVRFFSLAFGILAIPLAYALGRRWLSPLGSLLGALLMAFSPYLIWYSQEAKMYTLITFLTMLSLYLYVKALARGRWLYWAAYVVVTSFCLYVHILAALIIPLEIVLFMVWWPRHRDRLKSWLLALGCVTLPYIPLALWEIPLLLSSYQTGHPFYSLGGVLSILFFAFRHGVWGVASPWLLILTSVLFVFLFLAGLFLGDKTVNPAIDSDAWRGVTLLLYLFLPIIGVYLISLGMPIFADRYLIYVAPAFYLISARGLAAVKLRSNALFAICLALVLTFDVQSIWAQSHTRLKSDFRSAAQYFALHREPDDLVIFLMPYARHTFEYYYRGDYHWADGPYTNDGMSESELEAILGRVTKGHRSIWLVASEAELWDQRGLVKAWLDGNGRPVDEQRFVRVSLHRYELPVLPASQ
jgi:4-amino-4-deoxy-L-arabinose transferase-like glycosyltransferase